MKTDDAVAAFSERFGILFRPASPTEVATADSAGVPISLLEFYRDYEPTDPGRGEIRFFPLEKIVAEMTDFVPGCNLSPHGYFVVGSTDHGDVFCVRPKDGGDFRTFAVQRFSHEVDFEQIHPNQICEFAETVARGLPEFLARAATDRLGE
ncbi:MAG: hypothetical protein SFY80_15815 [Verrucomicrobiota bacterium]|nr:hypothetical protein [Verrucomicrobiota bacterium]